MKRSTENLWSYALELIRSRINKQSFDTWFSKSYQQKFGEGALVVRMPSSFHCEWLEENYIPLISNALKEINGKSIDVSFISRDSEKKASSGKKASSPVFSSNRRLNMNADFCFDSFVVGNSNSLAHSASLAVSEAPSKTKFNPLLIYGGTGLGKTHLLHAIGNHVKKNFKNVKIIYVSSDEFTNEFIDSIKNNKVRELSSYYRRVDLLLMDDVQFFRDKFSTQEVFFHIFNTLYQNGKQIVLSSDKEPRYLEGLEERLVSRFQWGLSVDIQSPDLETRTAILYKKAEKSNLSIPDDVIKYIANNISSNIRELEGSVIKLLACSSLKGIDIDIKMAEEVLKLGSPHAVKKIYVEKIIDSVSEYYKISRNDLARGGRKKEMIIPRQVAMFLCRSFTKSSLKYIGKFFGRDHSTVIHAVNNIETMKKKDGDLNTDVDNLAKIITGSY
jgi:chromosomal replication initiator protein